MICCIYLWQKMLAIPLISDWKISLTVSMHKATWYSSRSGSLCSTNYWGDFDQYPSILVLLAGSTRWILNNFQHHFTIMWSAKTKHDSEIQIFQYKAFKHIGWIITCFEKKSVNFFTHLVLGEWRGQQLKPGYHLICPKKRSLKIFVWLQCTQGIETYGHMFTWCQSGCLRSMFLHVFWPYLWW